MQSDPMAKTNTPSIGRAIAFMEQHLRDRVTMEEIAVASGFSKTTLQRRFAETTSVTIALFLRRLRLNAAAAELIATKRRIVDIALDYQFESQQTFARAFKQATWLTPGEARRLKRLPDLDILQPSAATAPLGSVSLKMRGAMIFTPNIEALKTFYHEVLGLRLLDEDPSFIQLDAGGTVLVLHQGSPRRAKRGPACLEINFFAADVDETRKALIERGAKIGPIGVFGDLRLCKGSDPDGNVFGISNRPLLRPLDL